MDEQEWIASEDPAAMLACVRELRRMFGTGLYTKAELARRLGISRMQVWAIVTGKKWAHVADEPEGTTS